MTIRHLFIVSSLSVFCLVNSAFATTPPNHNPNSYVILDESNNQVSQYPLVKNATVSVMGTDFWSMDIIVWQLTTTDATSDEPTWTSSNWSTKAWPYNECSATAPHDPSGNITFAINATVAGTDNKMQKVMSLLQIAQLTGMQVTIMGYAATGDIADECQYSNISGIYLRSTTYYPMP